MTDSSVFENKKAAYYTLGCKLNFAETSAIGKLLLKCGVRTVKDGECADICIINTCSVTSKADKECRNVIRLARKQHPEAFIVVTGCYAQLGAEEIIKIEGVNMVVGSNQKMDIVEQIINNTGLDKNVSYINKTETKDIDKFVPSCSSEERTRYFLKVQDGCDYSCTYCTIPKARGRSRNGSIDSILKQAVDIADKGGREIVLTGVNIGDFGRTTNETFFDLIKELDKIESIDRFRIGSIEPNLLKPEIIEFISNSKRIAPHFHIPLQSGSNDVLKLMRRRYNRELFKERVDIIKSLIPDSFIGVDVIVGTRGETEVFFEDSYKFISQLPLSQLHVFTYSERSGTDALKINYVVEPKEKHRRSQILQSLSDEKLRHFYSHYVDKPLSVLWEHGNKNGFMYGFSQNYLRVAAKYDETLIGKISIVCPSKIDESKNILYTDGCFV